MANHDFGQIRKVVKAARAAGWQVEKAKDGYKCYAPGVDRPITLHGSKGSRTWLNIRAEFKRAGLDLDA